jgi:hypothetical protein
MEIKKRHGLVAAWLLLMIGLGVYYGFRNLLDRESVMANFPPGTSDIMVSLSGLLSLANAFLGLMLFYWKKWAFWGIIGTSIAGWGMNLALGQGILASSIGLVGIPILYLILQLRKDTVSAWENLE